MSCTLCVTSTFGLVIDDKDDDLQDHLIRRSRALNATIDIPLQGLDFKPNPIKEGEKLKFDVSEDSPTEDEYDPKRRSVAPKIVFSK